MKTERLCKVVSDASYKLQCSEEKSVQRMFLSVLSVSAFLGIDFKVLR